MKKTFALLACITVIVLTSNASYSQNKVQLSFGAGAGLFVASDESRYMNIKYDLYPEIFMALDISGIRIGADLGLVYRKKEEWGFGWGDSYHTSETILFLPLQGYIGLYPLRFVNRDMAIQPYAHLGGGAFLSVGSSDYPDNEICVTGKLGLELNALRILGFHGDVRYTWADNDMGGIIITLGASVKLPISE